jgi:hypothetical protein
LTFPPGIERRPNRLQPMRWVHIASMEFIFVHATRPRKWIQCPPKWILVVFFYQKRFYFRYVPAVRDLITVTKADPYAYKVYILHYTILSILLYAYNRKTVILEYKRRHHSYSAWSIIAVQFYSTMYVLYFCLQMHERYLTPIHLNAYQ